MDVDLRGSSWTEVIDRAGVNERLERLRPLRDSTDPLFDFFLEDEDSTK